MKFILKFLLYTFLIILSLSTIYLWIQNNKLKDLLDNEISDTKVDTLYIPRFYKSPPPFRIFQKPDKVEIYIKPNSHTLSKQNSSKDSIISLGTSNRTLMVDALVNDTSYQRKSFNWDPSYYQYNYSQGKLTKKRLPFSNRLTTYIEFSYRPFNNFLDLGGGLTFKTRKFNYKLGINLSYYPKISSKVYKDLELGITYNF